MEDKKEATGGDSPRNTDSRDSSGENPSENQSKNDKVVEKGSSETDASAAEPPADLAAVVQNGEIEQTTKVLENGDHNKTDSSMDESDEQVAGDKGTKETNEPTSEDKDKKETSVQIAEDNDEKGSDEAIIQDKESHLSSEKSTTDKSEEKPTRATRGTKRKANDTFENESTINSTSNETTEQKENLEMKNNNVHKPDNSVDDAVLKSMSFADGMGKGKRARVPNKRYSDIILSPNRKSLSMPKSINDGVEIKQEKEEIVVTPLVTSVSSPGLPKRGRGTPREELQDPKYLKPFKYGWRRELVWRSTSTSDKKIGDIYYYNPEGKKVRSFRELADHLTGKHLSLDNFSYAKELLGVNDPEKEIERNAKIAPSQMEHITNSPTPQKVEPVKVKKVETPKVTEPAEIAKVDTPKQTTRGRGRKKASAPSPEPIVKKKKEQPKDTPTPVNSKMVRNKVPPAKKIKLSKKSEEPVVEPKPAAQPARSSPRKTRALPPPSTPQPQVQPKPVKKSLKLKNLTAHDIRTHSTEDKAEAKTHVRDSAFVFDSLLHVFQYLKVQDLLRASCVCRMWRSIANESILWNTVRMKNSQVHSFEGLANALRKHGTVHLDLRKMLLPSSGDDIWPEFSKAIARVDSLKKIEFCRCPASVVERLASSNTNLEVFNAVTIKCDTLDLDPFKSLTCIRELRLKSTSGLNVKSIDSLRELKTLKILSLTSVMDLHKLNLSVIGELANLESLDLGECSDFPSTFGQDILLKLDKLEKLRLEKGQGNCHTFEILESVKNMKRLEQLELVNFDVKPGFDNAIGECKNIKKLMIIPTYISQSATTNNMVLAGVLRLQGTLSNFVWGVTLELLRVTELFVDQCEETSKKEKKQGGNGDCIPVLKPVPDLSNGSQIQAANHPPQVEILPLPNLQKLLLNSLPTTRVKILKIPFHATWRQTLTDSL